MNTKIHELGAETKRRIHRRLTEPAALPVGPEAPEPGRRVPVCEMGARRLLCAIIEQAANDYRTAVRQGLIVGDLVVIRKNARRKLAATLYLESDLRDLVSFFQEGGPLDLIFETLGMGRCSQAVRKALTSDAGRN